LKIENAPTLEILNISATSSKNKSYKIHELLNFETYQTTRATDYYYDEDEFDKTGLPENVDLENYHEIYSVEVKSKMHSEKQTVTHKTGQFKNDCKLAKYQNKDFLAEPVIKTDHNTEKNQTIHDWLGYR